MPSAKCTSIACALRVKYHATTSNSYIKDSSSSSLHVGSGSSGGVVSQDTPLVGGLKLKNQPFAEMTTLKGVELALVKFDGGLGFGLGKDIYGEDGKQRAILRDVESTILFVILALVSLDWLWRRSVEMRY